jgi:acyl carrier protein
MSYYFLPNPSKAMLGAPQNEAFSLWYMTSAYNNAVSKIKKFENHLRWYFEIPAEKEIDWTDKFMHNLGDSLDYVEFVMQIEELFDIEIYDDDKLELGYRFGRVTAGDLLGFTMGLLNRS